MKRFYYYIILLLYPLITSCAASSKLSAQSFSKQSKATDLSGTYINIDYQLSHLFSIDSDKAYFVDFDFSGKDRLKLTYQTDSGLTSKTYKGKFKKNYFEIHFSKKLIPIPFLFGYDSDKVRIGLSEDSDLLIQQYKENIGWMIFFAAGSASEDEYTFQNIQNFRGLKPYLDDDKWGFADSLQNIVIEPRYDYVEFFKNGISRVKLDDKWGLINERGNELTAIKYDTIFPLNTDTIMEIELSGKVGFLNGSGKEVVPPVYDEAYYYPDEGLFKIKSDGKEGYYDKYGNEIVPSIYDMANSNSTANLIKVSLDGKEGFLDGQGNQLIPLVYENARFIQEANLIKVILTDGKETYLNKQGESIMPLYDKIGNFGNPYMIVPFFVNGKYGYRTPADIICPPVFDEAQNFTKDIKSVCKYAKDNDIPYGKVLYNGKHYLVDEDGFMYEYECSNVRKRFLILEESKMKIL